MPATKLGKALEAEQERNEKIEERLEALEAKGTVVRVPGTPFSVDLLTGNIVLNEILLKELRQVHHFSVDNHKND